MAPTKRTKKAAASRVAKDSHHCLCKAREDNEFLIQCDRCEKWWHPRCIGKGLYKDSYYRAKREWTQGKDVMYYKDRAFECTECVPGPIS